MKSFVDEVRLGNGPWCNPLMEERGDGSQEKHKDKTS